MVSGLEEFDAIVKDFVNESIDLRDPARPDVTAQLLQVFWFANTLIRISHNSIYEIESSKRSLAICVHPITQIFATLVLKHSYTLPTHGRVRVTPVAARCAQIIC